MKTNWRGTSAIENQISQSLSFGSSKCEYKFKKDGRLLIKIKLMQASLSRWGSAGDTEGTIEIEGTYTIENGKISSTVENSGVKTDLTCFAVDNYTAAPKGVSPERNWESDFDARSAYSVPYTTSEGGNPLRVFLLNNRYLWDWDNETITLSDGQLTIGDNLVCR